jgi:hypothetical protein
MIDHTTSVTSGMGTELHFIDIPNILPAFLLYIAGVAFEEAIKSIDFTSRLFTRTLRISGWSHKFENLMKFACKLIPSWLTQFSKMRAFCTFFSDASHGDVKLCEVMVLSCQALAVCFASLLQSKLNGDTRRFSSALLSS